MKAFTLMQYNFHQVKKFCIVCFCFLSGYVAVAQKVDVIEIKTFSKQNPSVAFRCRQPVNYKGDSHTKCRLLIYFGGRNTLGVAEIGNKVWTDWCDKNNIFLIVPSYKNDNYWEPQKWSGKALIEAIAQLKKKYQNICDDKLLFYGYSAGAQCSNLFPAWIPEKTRAYVSHACGVFHKPNERMKNVAGLLTCGDADRQRFVINHRFIEDYGRLGVNILWKSFPNHPHDVPQGSIYLAQAFLEYFHKFYSCDLEPSQARPKENRKPVFIGDDQDGVVYPIDAAAAKNIYQEDRVYFHSKQLADAWAKCATMQ